MELQNLGFAPPSFPPAKLKQVGCEISFGPPCPRPSCSFCLIKGLSHLRLSSKKKMGLLFGLFNRPSFWIQSSAAVGTKSWIHRSPLEFPFILPSKTSGPVLCAAKHQPSFAAESTGESVMRLPIFIHPLDPNMRFSRDEPIADGGNLTKTAEL